MRPGLPLQRGGRGRSRRLSVLRRGGRGALLALGLGGCAAPAVAPSGPAADGVSLGLFATDAFYDYGPMVEEIAELGAGSLLVVVPRRLDHSQASAPVLAVPPPTLDRTLRQARVQGLETTVMPVIDLVQRAHAGDWRGRLAPAAPDRFWSAYGAALDRVAVVAEGAGADRLVVGSELSSLEAEAERWSALISGLRDRFGGRLTYSANWDHHAAVPFWGALDEVGVTAYHPVDGADPAAAWSEALAAAAATAAENDRPLVITEYGYPALGSAAARPWDETTGAPADDALQAALYGVALAALACARPQAAFAWNWFGHPADPASPFSPRGRPAAAVLRDHFATAPAQRCAPPESR